MHLITYTIDIDPHQTLQCINNIYLQVQSQNKDTALHLTTFTIGINTQRHCNESNNIYYRYKPTIDTTMYGPVVQWLACLTFTAAIGVRIPVEAVNFHNANIYTIVPSGSNSFVLCPWMYLVFVLSTVLPSTCSLTNSDFMSCLEVIKG